MGDCGISWHAHDSGVVLTHPAVDVADGAACLSQLRTLRDQEALFGPARTGHHASWLWTFAESPAERTAMLPDEQSRLESSNEFVL